jgi:Spy/CpxP family protein refolding chaperone
MKKLTVIMLAGLLLMVFATSSFAFNGGRGMNRGDACGKDMTTFSQRLNLTADQSKSINALREANLKDMKPLQDKMFSKRGDLRLLWLDQNPNQEKIIALQKEIRNLRDQMQDKMINFRFAVAKVLTPEQKSKLESSFRGRAYGHGAGFGAMGCPGDPCTADFHGGPGRGMRGNR